MAFCFNKNIFIQRIYFDEWEEASIHELVTEYLKHYVRDPRSPLENLDLFEVSFTG